MAFLFDLKDLVDLMSIGTLLAYTLVAACVLVLRYQPDQPHQDYQMTSTLDELEIRESFSSRILPDMEETFSFKNLLFSNSPDPSELSGSIVNVCASLLGFLILVFCIVAVQGGTASWSVLSLCVVAVVCLFLTCIIWRQPENKSKLSFKVPLLPFIPVVSMFVNVYLMMQLDRGTWIRFALWLFIGLTIYFGYGIWHSVEGSVTHSIPDEDPDVCKSTSPHQDVMSLEKESFLYTRQEDRDDEDGEL